jgi:hypothetical protein
VGIRWTGTAALAVAAILAGSPAGAEDALARDLRCLIAMGSASAPGSDTPEDLKPSLLSGSMYYLGKVEGRDPDLDLEKLIADEAQKMVPEDMQDELVRCGRELGSRGEEMTSIAARLSARPDAQPPDAPDAPAPPQDSPQP